MDVPLKVCAWRLFRDRLPIKDNLFRRGLIGNGSRMCVRGCSCVETSAHLFLHCNNFGFVWHLIHHWLGTSSVIPFYVANLFNQLNYGAGGFKVRRSILQVIWFATLWEIWKEITCYSMARNARLCKWLIRLSHSHSCD